MPVAHVEAGLRSFDLSMPEERNRIEVDQVSALLFSPDELSADQLATEGVPGRVAVVGDVMADATRVFLPIARGATCRLEPPYVAVTIHREANIRAGPATRIAAASAASATSTSSSRCIRARDVCSTSTGSSCRANVEPIEPLGYLEMLAFVAGAEAVVTDSGGLQKEAYWLGVPCVTLRPNTEWVDTVEVGANTLVEPRRRSRGAARRSALPRRRTAAVRRRPRLERIAAALYP